MNKNTMEESTKTLNELSEKITNIKLTNPEIAEMLSAQLELVRKEFVNLDDENGHGSVIDLKAISDLTALEFQVNTYLQTGRISTDPILSFNEEETVSGRELEKRHMLDVYTKLTDITSKMPDVSIEKIKKMKDRWDEVKDTFSEVERSVVEENIAKAFLNFQIQYIRNNGEFSNEKIADYCDISYYERAYKERLVEHISNLPEDNPERLEMEIDMFNWDFNKAVKSDKKWKALAGVDFIVEDRKFEEATEESEKPKEEKKEPKKEENEERWDSGIDESKLIIDPSNPPTTAPSALIVYRIPKRDGSFKTKQKVVELDEKGRFKLFLNKEYVSEIYFLEGTEKLAFTDDGNSSSRFTRLCDLPNLGNVYLPKSLKEIEQGFFMGAEKLTGIYLPKGTMFNPNKTFLPEKAKVIKHPEEDQVEREIIEPQQEAAIIMQAIRDYTGNVRLYPFKVGISRYYGEIPKRLPQIIPEDVQSLYYTNGTTRISREHTVDDYDGSYDIKGFPISKFTNLESVYLPDSCKTIGSRQFEGCHKLKNVRFSPYTDTIQPYAFSDCTALEELNCPRFLKIIDQAAFKNCTNLRKVVFNEYLDRIGMSSFMNCSELKDAVFPEKIGSIGNHAFDSCFKLEEAILPRHVDYLVEDSVFNKCTNLKLLVLPMTAKSVFTNIATGCPSLNTIVIPSKDTNIRSRTAVAPLARVENYIVDPEFTVEEIEELTDYREGKPHLIPLEPNLEIHDNYRDSIRSQVKTALLKDKKNKELESQDRQADKKVDKEKARTIEEEEQEL